LPCAAIMSIAIPGFIPCVAGAGSPKTVPQRTLPRSPQQLPRHPRDAERPPRGLAETSRDHWESRPERPPRRPYFTIHVRGVPTWAGRQDATLVSGAVGTASFGAQAVCGASRNTRGDAGRILPTEPCERCAIGGGTPCFSVPGTVRGVLGGGRR
jgi:hypothetical protein